MFTLHTPIEPLRRSIFLALGLLGACGGDGGGTGSQTGTGETTQGPTTGMTLPTTGTSEDPTSGTAGTATGSEAGETTADASSTTSVTGTTDGTTGHQGTGTTGDTAVSESTTGQTTTGDTDTTAGESGETGLEPGCVELMQGFTDQQIPSGWVKCGDKLPHRVSAEACVVPATPASCNLDGQQCLTNENCVEQPFGSCQQFSVGFIACGCVYGCETDADCAPGTVCRCAGDVLGPVTRCVPSGCTEDSDCDAGEVCQFAQSEGYDCGAEVLNGACTTPADVCETDAPCIDTPCAFDGQKWDCSLIACGRPFVVEDAAVTAPPTMRDDWSAVILATSAPEHLSPALARHWTEVAGYEHASVASFARFILQLLAVGAGPELVLAAQQALADEVEHARLCFALASLYAGHGVGPGPLPQASTPGASERAAIVEAVIREACVGETLAAFEAREAAAQAVDPGLRRVLTKIADDEQRHAELGWRFVRWALEGADAEACAGAQRAFAAAIGEATTQASRLAAEPATPELRAHGVIDAPLRAALWQRCLAGLVTPAAAVLAA